MEKAENSLRGETGERQKNENNTEQREKEENAQRLERDLETLRRAGTERKIEENER